MKHVLLYRPAADDVERAPAHFPAHLARLHEFHARGVLLMVGTFADPLAHGAMSIWTTREAVDEFVAGDPFVLHGVVRDWEVREWDEILTGP